MNAAPLVVITDLDGTFLDRQTYRCDASLPALRKLQSLNVPVVLCSSKTRSEIEPLWRELGLRDPFIVENGGAIFIPPDYFDFEVPGLRARGKLYALELGQNIAVLRAALQETARSQHVAVRAFGDMTIQEISDLTGLPRRSAQAAAEREYDEPFLLKQINHGRLFTALRTKGFKITQGDRFYHLSRGSDKGRATKMLLDFYRQVQPELRSVGLGDAGQDLGMLREVDRPILVRKPDRSWDSTITQNMSGIKKTMQIGPAGWSEAIEETLQNLGVTE